MSTAPARRALLAAVLGVVLAAAACAGAPSGSGGGEPAPAGDRAAVQAPASEPPPLPCVPAARPFSGPAAARFGADAVMAAYCEVAALSLEQAFTRLVLPGEGRRPADYAAVRAHLTDRARRAWDRDVLAWLSARDAAAGARLSALTLHDVADVPRGYLVAPAGSVSYGEQVGAGRATVAPGGRLRLRLPVSTGLVLLARGDTSGRHSLLPVTKRLTVDLVPPATAGGRWLLDGWSATFRRGEVRGVVRG